MAAGNGAARWQTITSIAASGAVAAVSLGAIVYNVVSVSFEVQIQKERGVEFVRRLDTLREDIEKMKAQVSQQKNALLEIETQFCGEDNVRNLMHANDLRVQSLLWEKAFGTTYPITNPFYPSICNRKE